MAKYRLVKIIDRSRRGSVSENYGIQRRILWLWWFLIKGSKTSSLPDAQYDLSIRQQVVRSQEIQVLHHDIVFIQEKPVKKKRIVDEGLPEPKMGEEDVQDMYF